MSTFCLIHLNKTFPKTLLLLVSFLGLAIAKMEKSLLRRVFLGFGLNSFLYSSVFAKKKPFLRLSGAINKFTDEDRSVYDFTENEIFDLPKNSITTSTWWTPKSRFVGVKFVDILQRVDAVGNVLRITAYDNYSVDVNVADVAKYGAILAYEKDGDRLNISTFGPLWLIYPRDQFPKEINRPAMTAKFIWQVWKVVVI